MDINAIVSIVSVSIAFVSVIFVILAYAKSNTHDRDGDVESKVRMNVQLTDIASKLSDIQTDIKAMQKNYSDLDKRVVIVERDLGTAFMRIDELKAATKGE